MKISGIIDFSMDNFLCIRGFAHLKDLYMISESIPEIQRSLIEEHKGEMADFLNKGEFTFFPEVILSTVLSEGEDTQKVDNLYSNVRQKNGQPKTKINDLNISISCANKTKSKKDGRIPDVLCTANMEFDEKNMKKFYRIDGNHRLSAAEESKKDYSTPFCLLLFKTPEESNKFNRAIFHNINAKQIPLKLEQNLKVIIDGEDVFVDEMLANDPSFGYHYYLARKVLKSIDLSYFPFVNGFISESKNTYFVDLFKYLIEHGMIEKNEEGITIVKNQLGEINKAIEESEIINTTENIAVIGAMSYYKLESKLKYECFIKWIKKNNIGLIENLHIDDVIKIYDNIYQSTPKKVFLARWYPAESDSEYTASVHRLNAIKSVVDELGLEFVDLGTKISGTYDIRSLMYREIASSDIFIADLTGIRHNVMVEVGYALQHIETGRMLFYFQKTDKVQSVPFDLNGFRWDEITDSSEMKTKIKPHIESIIKSASEGNS